MADSAKRLRAREYQMAGNAEKFDVADNEFTPDGASGGTWHVPVILAAMAGIIVSVGVCGLVWVQERETRSLEVEQLAQAFTGKFREIYTVNLETLQSIAGFYEGSRAVDRREFGVFVSRTFERTAILQGLGWAPVIRRNDRADYEARAAASGVTDFRIYQWNSANEPVVAAERDEYIPVFFAEPAMTNRGVLGFDLLTDLPRRQALETARDLNRPIATPPVRLIHNQGRGNAVIVYMPIYSNGFPHATVEERRANIHGFASAVFAVDSLVDATIDSQGLPGVRLRIFSAANGKSEEIYPGADAVADGGEGELTKSMERYRVEKAIEVAGRPWKLVFTPTPAFFNESHKGRPWIALALCLAFATVLVAWVYSLASRQTRVQKLVSNRTSELVIANAALKKENHERRRAERKLKERSAELQEMNKELESFSYSVSHDLRAPLRAINGFTGFVLKNHGDKLPSDAREQLEQVKAGGERMNRLIEGLLQFSRVQRQELKKRNCDISEMARGIMTELQSTMPQKRVEVIWGRLPNAFADPTLIRQVWQNLMSNALKYSSHEDASLIEIGSKNIENEVAYYVRDNGAGFDMKQASRLFGVFQRLHSEREFEGTGIGLANVHKIIQRHGGNIWAEAEVNKGAIFFFNLGPENVANFESSETTFLMPGKKKL